MFEWGNVSTHGLLFQLASTKNIPFKHVGLVQNGQLVLVIERHWIGVEQSLTHWSLIWPYNYTSSVNKHICICSVLLGISRKATINELKFYLTGIKYCWVPAFKSGSDDTSSVEKNEDKSWYINERKRNQRKGNCRIEASESNESKNLSRISESCQKSQSR